MKERKYFIFFISMQTFSLLKAETDAARAATKGGRYLLQDSPMLVKIRIKERKTPYSVLKH